MGRGVNGEDRYLEALVKNMPSETMAGYLATLGLVSGAKAPGWLLWVIWALFLIATPLFLWLAQPKNEKEQALKRPWWQVWIFSPPSFVVWSMTAGGAWAGVEWAGIAGGVGVILLSVLIFPLVSMLIAK